MRTINTVCRKPLFFLLAVGLCFTLTACGQSEEPLPSAPVASVPTAVPTHPVAPVPRDQRILMEGSQDNLCFGSSYKKNQIRSITFLDTLSGAPADAWDVSQDQNGNVLAWVVLSPIKDDVEDQYDLFIGAEGGVVAPANSAYLFGIDYDILYHKDSKYDEFDAYSSLRYIHFNNNFDTSSVTNMRCMFYQCYALKEFDFTQLDTSSVTDMSYMFGGCSYLRQVNLGDPDTSAVTNMAEMFFGCKNLVDLDLSTLDTSAVTNMDAMFNFCVKLETLNLSGWDTSAVTTMRNMFCNCDSLRQLQIDGWNTASVTDMFAMFWNCGKLTSLDLSSFDTSSVTTMYGMFRGCESLTQLDLSSFDMSNVTTTDNMFTKCYANIIW